MALRPAVLLVTATVLALGTPGAMAANNGRGKPTGGQRIKKKAGAQRTTPTRPVRRNAGAEASLQGTRTRAAAAGQAPQRGVQPAARPERRVIRGQQEQEGQYRTPYHAARARQQSARRGGWRGALIAGGIVLALGVGFVVGDALGLDNAVGNLFDNIGGGGESGPPDGWNTPPDGWPGDIDAPKPGEWPSWAPDKPGGGGGGPPSFEQVQEQLDKLMGRTPAPTK